MKYYKIFSDFGKKPYKAVCGLQSRIKAVCFWGYPKKPYIRPVPYKVAAL
jgi:hypothetical protein